MNKVRTPDECAGLLIKQKEYEESCRSVEFNKSVTKVVELVRTDFIGKSCVVPLKIVYHTHNMDGSAIIVFVERDKEVINAAVDILREEFREAGWFTAIYAVTPIWPFVAKIVISVNAMQYTSRPGKK